MSCMGSDYGCPHIVLYYKDGYGAACVNGEWIRNVTQVNRKRTTYFGRTREYSVTPTFVRPEPLEIVTASGKRYDYMAYSYDLYTVPVAVFAGQVWTLVPFVLPLIISKWKSPCIQSQK